MDQQYCLRWHNHPTNLTGVLMSLLQREALCDVTLAVEGETIKAHQTILSACSPYFETIFIQNTHPHPIMYLKDVDYVDLKAIIEYMYKGEVNVAQRSLPKFLKTAEGLQVKGLVESNNLNPSSIYRPSSDGDRNSTDTPPNYPSDNNNPSKYENLDRRDIDERSSIIGDKIGDKEAHIEFRDYGDKDMHDAHLDLSPVLDKHSRKRRNPSNCDTPSSLPQTQIPLSRHFSESQASSHSSYKLSPLPKSNSLEADTDGRRKSPVTNSLAGIQQQQQQQISIKQEASDITSGLPLPQVHLNPNPMNQNLLPHLLANDDFLSVSNAIQSNESSENDQQLTQVEQAEREIDGAEGLGFADTHHKTSPNGNIDSHKFPAYMENDKWQTLKYRPPNIALPYPAQISSAILDIGRNSRGSSLHHEDSLKWMASESSLRVSPIDYDRGQPLKMQSSHHQMSYHNMFTPSQEPGTLWRCRSCGKEVTNRWHHFHSHTAQRSMCPYCPATYSRIDTLRSHLKQKHKEHAHKNF